MPRCSSRLTRALLLVTVGLLTRRPDCQDGRATLLSLRPAGRKALSRLRDAGGDVVTAAAAATGDVRDERGAIERCVDAGPGQRAHERIHRIDDPLRRPGTLTVCRPCTRPAGPLRVTDEGRCVRCGL
jgi:hypothetical protein